MATDNPVFVPPFLGSRVERGISLDDIAAYLNETALFRDPVGLPAGQGRQETDAEFKERIRAELRAQLAAARAAGVLQPAVAYGYFAVNAEGDDLDRLEGRRPARPSGCASRFPRQPAEPWLCIADFFRSGGIRRGRLRRLPRRHHGRAGVRGDGPTLRRRTATRTTCTSTASGSRWPRPWPSSGTGASARSGASRARTARRLAGLFRQQYRGGRYSWGYTACPDLEDNAKCAELVGADRIGVEVSEETSWQFHPEQTTAAIICHHPQAKYFVVRRP